VALAYRDRAAEVAAMVALLAGFVISLLFFPEAWEHYYVKRFEILVNHPDNVNKFGKKTMTLTAEHIRVLESGAEMILAWDRVVRVARTDGHLFIYTSAVDGLAIQHASLEGASFDEVWTRLNECLPPRDEGEA
jgi:hypothetical protein